MAELTLGELQEKFSELEAHWVIWVISHPGWKLRAGEGRILPLGPDGRSGRRAYIVDSGTRVSVRDGVHLTGGAHYKGLAADWNLIVDGKFITSSGHFAWVEAGAKWESMDPLCRWGGRFTSVDGNHISLYHDGVA